MRAINKVSYETCLQRREVFKLLSWKLKFDRIRHGWPEMLREPRVDGLVSLSRTELYFIFKKKKKNHSSCG